MMWVCLGGIAPPRPSLRCSPTTDRLFPHPTYKMPNKRRSVNLADDDQVLAPKGDRLVRRKEEMDRLAMRCKTHRAYLSQGLQVWPRV